MAWTVYAPDGHTGEVYQPTTPSPQPGIGPGPSVPPQFVFPPGTVAGALGQQVSPQYTTLSANPQLTSNLGTYSVRLDCQWNNENSANCVAYYCSSPRVSGHSGLQLPEWFYGGPQPWTNNPIPLVNYLLGLAEFSESDPALFPEYPDIKGVLCGYNGYPIPTSKFIEYDSLLAYVTAFAGWIGLPANGYSFGCIFVFFSVSGEVDASPFFYPGASDLVIHPAPPFSGNPGGTPLAVYESFNALPVGGPYGNYPAFIQPPGWTMFYQAPPLPRRIVPAGYDPLVQMPRLVNTYDKPIPDWCWPSGSRPSTLQTSQQISPVSSGDYQYSTFAPFIDPTSPYFIPPEHWRFGDGPGPFGTWMQVASGSSASAITQFQTAKGRTFYLG